MLESTKHKSYSLETATDECLELSEEALNTLKVPGQPAHKIPRDLFAMNPITKEEVTGPVYSCLCYNCKQSQRTNNTR